MIRGVKSPYKKKYQSKGFSSGGYNPYATERKWMSRGSNSDIVALSATSLILVMIPYVTSVELWFNHTALKVQLART